MREKCLNRKGLSMVEVVIASVIVAVLLAGLYAVFINAKNLTVLSLHKMEAMVWAQSLLEIEASGLGTGNCPDPSDGNSLSEKNNVTGSSSPAGVNTVITRHTAVVSWEE